MARSAWLAGCAVLVLSVQGACGSGTGSDASSSEGLESGEGPISSGATNSETSGEDSSTSPSANTDGDDDDDCPHPPVDGDPELEFEEVADGFNVPLYVTSDPSDPDRYFVVERSGAIKILEPGEDKAPSENFLKVNVTTGGAESETGLLGFAFHPDYPSDKRVYINYNPSGGSTRTVVSEFKIDGSDPDKVDADSERIILEIPQPRGNHNGGMITFGPDKYLYIGMGDGGGGGDPFENGQDKTTLLGTILRIDVDPSGNKEYTIPSDNPFVNDSDAKDEIWAYGLRNPWRFDFDRKTGILYAGDVGQVLWEEIDIIEKGKNYGWNAMEGTHCYPSGSEDCSEGKGPNEETSNGYVLPIAEYRRGSGGSVTGGYVYRYCEVPAWEGRYFYADYVNGGVYALEWDGSQVKEFDTGYKNRRTAVTSFGIDGRGQVLATAVEKFGEFRGLLLRLAPKNQ